LPVGFDHNFLPDILIAVTSADDCIGPRSKFEFTHFKAAQFPDSVNGDVGEIVRLDGDFYRRLGNADQLTKFFYSGCQLRSPRLDVLGFTD